MRNAEVLLDLALQRGSKLIAKSDEKALLFFIRQKNY
jgi:hypothetical protein